MADKTVPLSIVLRTVDKATAGIQAFNKKLDAQLKPVRDFKKAFGELRENLNEKFGFSRVADGIRGVGGAVRDLIGKFAMVGGVVAVATAGVLHLVDEFDDLGDKAERMGVSVDFLASMRFAAERTGASVESLDAGLQTFAQNLGQARAGTGRMAAFLNKVSPALLRQLKATKSNEEAFNLMAKAMAKVKDPAKRLALAQKTVGDPALAVLLARGADGVDELRKRFLELAGSQEDAASAAGPVDDALKDLKASTTGVKAALVTGLAPALGIVIEKLTKWLVGHREDIKRWAIDIGEKLPGAIERVVKWIGKAYDWATKFVDAIGGIKVVALGLVAFMTGPLIGAVAKLGIAMLTTPFGPWIAGLAALAAGFYAATKALEYWNASTGQRSGRASDLLKEGKLDAIDAVVSRGADEGLDAIDSVVHTAPLSKRSLSMLSMLRPTAHDSAKNFADYGKDARITVDFANAPRGTRVVADPRSTANVDLSVGYQMP